MPSIVFVCTGNTCRSPMAEEIGRRLLADDVRVSSAGVAAVAGVEASNHARFVVADRGGDLSGHRSRLLDGTVLEEADLVVTMTRGHRQAVLALAAHRAGDVLTLGELASSPQTDVADPFGGTLEDYERTYEQIEGLLRAALPTIGARLRDGRSQHR